YCAVSVQRDDRLHRSLAEALSSHDRRAVAILQRAGDDLRGRCGGAVDQHRDRDAGQHVAMRGSLEHLIIACEPAMDADHGAAVEQIPGHIDGRVQKPSRIVAQIEYEALDASVCIMVEISNSLLESV